jgi:hypothetical protein
MQKRKLIFYTIVLFVFIMVSLTVIFFLVPKSSVFAVETQNKDIGITTSPEKQLLKDKNMAPGDKASAPLTVMNTGEHDFYYNISAKMESGDKLYNYLDLEITDQNHKILYSGKLKDLNDLSLGMLGGSKSDIFNVTIGLPSEAGNEYQGIYTYVKFILKATDRPSARRENTSPGVLITKNSTKVQQ